MLTRSITPCSPTKPQQQPARTGLLGRIFGRGGSGRSPAVVVPPAPRCSPGRCASALEGLHLRGHDSLPSDGSAHLGCLSGDLVLSEILPRLVRDVHVPVDLDSDREGVEPVVLPAKPEEVDAEEPAACTPASVRHLLVPLPPSPNAPAAAAAVPAGVVVPPPPALGDQQGLALAAVLQEQLHGHIHLQL